MSEPNAATESATHIKPSMLSRIKGVNFKISPSRLRQRLHRRENPTPTSHIIDAPVVHRELNRKLRKKNFGKTTSSSYPPTPAHEKNEQYASSSSVQVADRATGESNESGLSAEADKREVVMSTTPLTAGTVGLHTGAVKSDSSLADADTGEAIGNALGSADSKLRRARTFASGKLRFITGYYGRKYPGRAEPSTSAVMLHTSTEEPSPSIVELGVPSSVHYQPDYSETMQHEKPDVSAPLAYVAGSQLSSADTKDTEQAGMGRESEVVEKLRQDLSYSHAQVAELQRRCEAQSRDLENSNNFLNTADKSSDSDVTRALQRLNAELQQNTTYMADWLAEAFEFRDLTTIQTKEQSSAVQRASDYVGRVLVKSLQIRTSEDIPMLLQIAFQAYLAFVLCRTTSSWAFEAGHDAFIRGIYKRLRIVGKGLNASLVPANEMGKCSIEAQAISGRWRALARVHVAQNCITHSESLVKAIIMNMSDILLATGCTVPQSDIIQTVTSKFEEKIALLVNLAGRLNNMFDDVISSDFEAFVVQPGENFDRKRMDNADDTRVGIHQTSVLCTSHLGLMKRVPVGTLWEKGKKQKIIVLKAKVFLDSFLDAVD